MSEDRLRLGGMALRNGLLVHGPTHWAAAVRAPGGGIDVGSGRKPRLAAVDGVPGVRGVVRLAEAFAVIPLVRRALPAARLPFEDPRLMAAVGGTAVVAGFARRRGIAGEALAAVLSLAPALMALRTGELAQYHGAEHKAIGAYELEATDAVDAPKEHERCGSHLIAPLTASSLAGAALLRAAVKRPGRIASGAVALASAGVAVEVFLWSERHQESPLARALKRPGLALQRGIATREPSPGQLEVAEAALAEILRVEGVAEVEAVDGAAGVAPA